MRILICDDEIKNVNTLQTYVEEYMNNHGVDFEIETATNPNDVVAGDTIYDLVFLDIEMPELDGFKLARELKERNSKVVIFFVTAFDEYQDDAMDLQVFRFFEKPFDVKRLYSSLDKAMEYIDGAYVDVFLYTDGGQQRVLVDDILYITRANRKVVMVTTNGALTTKESFDEWCDKLPPLFFYAVHKSFLVNLHYINRYSYGELTLNDGTKIPIAPRRQSAFHKYWFEYLRRR